MDVAVKERLIVRNPTDGTTIPKKTTTEKQVLDDGQLERFMEERSKLKVSSIRDYLGKIRNI